MPVRLSIMTLALFLCLGISAGFAATTERVSVTGTGLEGDAGSFSPCISGNGRYVAFDSDASNLVPGDTNGVADVFVYDTQSSAIERVSVASDVAEADDGSYLPSISSDGRYVAFESDATNLVPSDTNGATDIFVHDRDTGLTTRVSVASGGTQADDGSFYVAISADGRYVSFESDASNLVAGDNNGLTDVFVHDCDAGATTIVSVATGGGQGDGFSYGAAISGDGRYVTFESDSSNLAVGDTNWVSDIFVHDCNTGTTTRVSLATGGGQGNDGSYNAMISADGAYVTFDSDATNLVSGDTNGLADVFVRDLQAGETARCSIATGGAEGAGGYWGSLYPSVSADGRYVGFESDDTNLVAGDINAKLDIFIHDAQTGETTRVSVDTQGQQSDGDAHGSSISADGARVAFDSVASNLVSGDTNGASDVFLYDKLAMLLSLTGSGNGSVRVNGELHALPWSGDFDSGTEVALQAEPDSCYRFDGWSGDLTGAENPTTITMTSNQSVAANFASLLVFPDVGCDHWAVGYIVACYEAGIVQGYWNGYHPDEAVNRAQMAVFMARAVAGGDANVPPGPATATFPDVPTSHWAFKYVEYCYDQAVVAGYWDGYHPDTTVNRAQMAVFVARSMVAPTGDAAIPDPEPPPTFPDVPATYWAYKWVEYCHDHGVVQGYWDGYRPEETVNRAQMAVFVQRAFDLPM
jgi:Tol biopolymer transport system component